MPHSRWSRGYGSFRGVPAQRCCILAGDDHTCTYAARCQRSPRELHLLAHLRMTSLCAAAQGARHRERGAPPLADGGALAPDHAVTLRRGEDGGDHLQPHVSRRRSCGSFRRQRPPSRRRSTRASSISASAAAPTSVRSPQTTDTSPTSARRLPVLQPSFAAAST